MDLDVLPAQVVAEYSATAGFFALESLVCRGVSRCFSIYGIGPTKLFITRNSQGSNPFDYLDLQLKRYSCQPPDRVPVAGGWVGFLGYEAGRFLERLPRQTKLLTSLPVSRFALYDTVAVYDHRDCLWYVAGIDLPDSAAPLEQRLAHLERWLAACGDQPTHDESPRTPSDRAVKLSADMTLDEYLAKVEQARDYIAAGDIFQVNLTRRFSARVADSSSELYRRLRYNNPGDYAAFFHWDRQAVLCSSPELFLQVRDREVLSSPIKGTSPRTGDEEVDSTARRELLASEKDSAELYMIVDLVRNDLGRVCEYGSVRVKHAKRIETHPTVFHLVADVTGRLRENATCVDLLRASFPAGSITGAPKVRAMEIIDELEHTERGVYCGAIGWLGFDGSMVLNVAIRTMVYDGGGVHIGAGGAVTTDSDPMMEHRETLAKARGMFRAVGVREVPEVLHR